MSSGNYADALVGIAADCRLLNEAFFCESASILLHDHYINRVWLQPLRWGINVCSGFWPNKEL